MHRVIPDAGDWFGPIGEAFATVFIRRSSGDARRTGICDRVHPAFLGGCEADSAAHLRDLLALPVRQAGLGIQNPAKKVVDGYRASIACTKTLAESLLDRSDLDTVAYTRSVKEARVQTRKARTLLGLAELQTLCNVEQPVVSRRMKCAKETVGWLNTLPNNLNGTVLSEEEFRESLRLRFGLIPLKLPSKCDCCCD
jgi:hypothetical protein